MTSPSRHGRLTGSAITWLTLVGLGLVLFVFAALIVGGSIRDTATAERAQRSGDLAKAYLRAEDALAREDDLEDRYLEEHDPALHAPFNAAARDLTRAVVSLERHGAARDRALARRASALHRRYVVAMRDIFAVGDDTETIEKINDERMDAAQDALRDVIHGEGPRYAMEQLGAFDELRRGERQELIATSIAVSVGSILYLLLVVIFVRQRRRVSAINRARVARLDEEAHTDSLTGLLNRRALERDLERGDGTLHAMAMFDVVGLKRVNDGQGHSAGDALLRDVAAALCEEAAGRGRAYRVGGDEFVLVLPAEDETAGQAAVDAVRARIAVTHPAGVRAGVAAGDDVAELQKQASRALLDVRQACPLARVA